MNVTQWAAWVGAFSGLGSLLWNVFTKLTSGPRLKLTVRPGMVKYPDPREGTLYITARVCNVGTAKTTITNMCLVTYESIWKRKRLSRGFVVASPSAAQPIPFKLEVGEEWCGMATQDAKMQELIDGGKLWCEIYHSWSKKPIRGRVISCPVKPAVKPGGKTAIVQ
jgi:hypothetical protein